jgi:hypothetical protein
VKLGTTVGNIGLEGVSYDPLTNGYVLVKEKDPQSIFQTGITFAFGNTGTATNGSLIATSSTDLFNPALASLLDFSDVFALSNLPFLSGQTDFNHLLVISQESGQIINVDRSGNVSSRLTIVADVGSPLPVPDMTMEGITMDRDGNLYVVNENGGGDANHPQLWVYAHSNAPNLAPTGLTLGNVVASMPENTNTAAAVKVADILVADDGLGVNNLLVTGPDAAKFQIIGSALFLQAGTVLDSVAKPNYTVTVSVDDTTVGLTPDAQADYHLTITASTGGTTQLIISEVAPWSSGNSPAALMVDWFELTNIGTAAATVTGFKIDDNSNSFASSVPMTGITKIAPGESVIFMELAVGASDAVKATKKAAFLSTWFGSNPPANLQIGSYAGSGVGLSTGGDAVNVYDSTGVLQANVAFGQSATGPFLTFDNRVGLNNTTISALSANGIGGAFVAANDPLEVGSPGTIGPPVTPVVSITANPAVASETGPTPGTFRFSRTGSVVGALNVNYTIATGPGKASSADVLPALTNVVTIPAGKLFVDFVVTPVDDALFEGTETLTLTVFDTGSYDVLLGATSASVTITDNDPPNTFIDSAPSTPTQSTSATFTFHASDPLSAIAGLECSRDGEAFSACSGSKAYSGLSDGSHTFAVRAIDTAGHIDPTPATFTWMVDNAAPIIAVGASETTLWPPTGQMVPDRITGRVTDALSGVDPSTVAFRVTDSYGAVQPAGSVVIDADGRFSFTVSLEASRRGQDKDGRRYDVTVTASDNAGNRASATVTVSVPHDRGK